jgi:hypothetical protein
MPIGSDREKNHNQFILLVINTVATGNIIIANGEIQKIRMKNTSIEFFKTVIFITPLSIQFLIIKTQLKLVQLSNKAPHPELYPLILSLFHLLPV